MSNNPGLPSNLAFYSIGILLVLLGVAFLLIPLIGQTGAFSHVKIPSIILYVYNKGGFYFVTSPILIIISLIFFIVFLVRR